LLLKGEKTKSKSFFGKVIKAIVNMQHTHLLTAVLQLQRWPIKIKFLRPSKKALSDKPHSNRSQMGQKDCSNIGEVLQNPTTLKKKSVRTCDRPGNKR